jgi:hypothetical protein
MAGRMERLNGETIAVKLVSNPSFLEIEAFRSTISASTNLHHNYEHRSEP